MPKLTGKELSDLYPTPKTFDEQRAEMREIQEARRPRFVPLKVATWVAVGVLAVLAASRLVAGIMTSSITSSELAVLSGVAFSGFVGLGGIAAAWYVYKQIDELASKVIVSPPLLYAVLAGVLSIGGLLFETVQYFLQNFILAAALLLVSSFILSFLAVVDTLKRQ